MRRLRTLRTLVVTCLSLTSAGLVSCAHYGAQPLPERPGPSAVAGQRTTDDLYVTAYHVAERAAALESFDRDLVAHGVCPVVVHIELNESATASFDIAATDVQLVLSSGVTLDPVDAETVASAAAYSHWRSAFGFLFLLPGFFVASSVNSANELMASDYEEKSLHRVRIGPRNPRHQGVIFFAIPDTVASDFAVEDAFLEFKVYRQDAGRLDGVIDIPVHFEN